jgi:hypothetical protein
MLGGPQPVIGGQLEVKVLFRGRATVLGTHKQVSAAILTHHGASQEHASR